jgi:hypothetical protein
MSSELAKLRAAAEPFKSFPKAVAAIVRAAFDRGATQVEVRFDIDGESGDTSVWIKDDGYDLTHAQQTVLVSLRQASERSFPDNIGLTFVHHAYGLIVIRGERLVQVNLEQGVEDPEEAPLKHFSHQVGIGFIALGKGNGVNPRQDRSAKRLIRELPRLLSPSEAYHTTVIDESGKEHALVKNAPSTVIDGFRIAWLEKMIGFVGEGLVFKFGAVRVPMSTFLALSLLPPEERERLNILTHPWLQGVVEITSDPDVLSIPVPPKAADNFNRSFYETGFAVTLARVIAQILPAVVVREMNKTINLDLSDYGNSEGELTLDGRTYKLSCADELNLWRVQHVVLGGAHTPEGEEAVTILINPTHPVFRTIGPDRDEIMQVIWWQLAIWIASWEQPEVFEELKSINLRINGIYLALRAQNLERDWDE